MRPLPDNRFLSKSTQSAQLNAVILPGDLPSIFLISRVREKTAGTSCHYVILEIVKQMSQKYTFGYKSSNYHGVKLAETSESCGFTVLLSWTSFGLEEDQSSTLFTTGSCKMNSHTMFTECFSILKISMQQAHSVKGSVGRFHMNPLSYRLCFCKTLSPVRTSSWNFDYSSSLLSFPRYN